METKKTDMWKTPSWLYRMLVGSPHSLNSLMDRTLLSKDGIDWLQPNVSWEQNSFVNPPYSDPLPFVLKGIEQHKKNNITVVFLLKVDTTTKWYKALVEANAHFLYFAERLHYSDSKESPPFSSMLAILSAKV